MTKKEKIIYDSIAELRSSVVPSRERNLKHTGGQLGSRHGVTYQDTQYYYYRVLINDTLEQIRKGREAYIFNLEQVAEILRFEPKAHFEYFEDSDSIRVTL